MRGWSVNVFAADRLQTLLQTTLILCTNARATALSSWQVLTVIVLVERRDSYEFTLRWREWSTLQRETTEPLPADDVNALRTLFRYKTLSMRLADFWLKHGLDRLQWRSSLFFLLPGIKESEQLSYFLSSSL